MEKLMKNILHLLVCAFCLLPLGSSSQNIDVNILNDINPNHPTSQYWIQTTNSAYWLPAGFMGGTLLHGIIKNDRHEKIKGYEAIISVGSAIVVTGILKTVINRTRPADAYPDKIFTNSPTHGGSFPSGHATLAFSTATTIALQYKRWYIVVPAYLWAGSEAYSRMYLGKHYPTDVLAGVAIGVGGAYFSHWLTKKIFREKKPIEIE
ncbi:MAG: phosphatase PAP2 family protein [Ginsengibacter sp.]